MTRQPLQNDGIKVVPFEQRGRKRWRACVGLVGRFPLFPGLQQTSECADRCGVRGSSCGLL